MTGVHFLPPEDEAGLDDVEVEAALIDADGNVAQAAGLLGVRSDRLRRYVAAKPDLKAVLAEIMDVGIDQAIGVLFEGLKSPHWTVKFAAAKEMLHAEAAARRGFGPGSRSGAAFEVRAPAGTTLQLRWIGDDKLIEGEVTREAQE